jgi:hypothetical protein
LRGVLALARRANAELLQLAVEVGALEPNAVGDAGHVALLAPDVMQEILLLELLAGVAQGQVERYADLRGDLLARPEIELACDAVHVVARDVVGKRRQCEL